jgi:hypothetical protein
MAGIPVIGYCFKLKGRLLSDECKFARYRIQENSTLQIVERRPFSVYARLSRWQTGEQRDLGVLQVESSDTIGMVKDQIEVRRQFVLAH